MSENVRPISSVPNDPPRCEAWSILVSSDGGNSDLKRAEQAEAEDDED